MNTQEAPAMPRFFGILLSVAYFAAPCWASDPGGTRPIRIVVPYAAGGDTDGVVRTFVASAKKYLDTQDIVVDNVVGASGAKASSEVKAAPADGLTLLAARVGSHAILPALVPQTSFRAKDFTALAILETSPLVCAVRADSPIMTIRELLQAIRRTPGVLKFGTAGAGTIQNIASRYLLLLGGLRQSDAIAMHFDNGLEPIKALLDGRVDFSCSNAVLMVSPIQSGKLRGLMTTAQGRMLALPDLVNASEAGFRDMTNLQGWTALVGPKNVPVHVTERWKTILRRVARDPEWLAASTRIGAVSMIDKNLDAGQFIQRQEAMYEHLVVTMEIRP